MSRSAVATRLMLGVVAPALIGAFVATAPQCDASAQGRMQSAGGQGAGYMRTRPGAPHGATWIGHRGRRGFAPNGFYGYGAPLLAAEYSGHWYARPYPYHFDYYRHRWSTPNPAVDSADDCPCAASASELPAPAPTTIVE